MFRPIAIAISLCLVGCTAPKGIHSGYEFDLAGSKPGSMRVLLGPGATVEVKFLYTPELNQEQMIRADGLITLPLIGDLEVAGRTPSEVRKMLLSAYDGKLLDPQITVLVRGLSNNRVYVGGQVLNPGSFTLDAPLTVMEALMLAGGPDLRQAALDSVVVVRHGEKSRRSYRLDMDAALGGERHKPFYLRQHDVIFVPRTTIVKVDQWVDQYINKLFPQIGFLYRKPIGGGAVIGFEGLR